MGPHRRGLAAGPADRSVEHDPPRRWSFEDIARRLWSAIPEISEASGSGATRRQCGCLQESFDVLALDKAMDESSAALNARRQGLEADRKDGLELISTHTMKLLTRMDAAAGAANKKMLRTRTKSQAVIDSGSASAGPTQPHPRPLTRGHLRCPGRI